MKYRAAILLSEHCPGCTGRNTEEPRGNEAWKERPQCDGILQVVPWHALAPASFRHCPGSILPLPCTIVGAVLPYPSSLAWPRRAPIAQQQPQCVVNAVLACTRATSKSYNCVTHQNDSYLSTV